MAKFSSASEYIIVSIGRKADRADAFEEDAVCPDDFRWAEVEFCSALTSDGISLKDVQTCLPYVYRHGRKNLAMIMTKRDWRWLAIQLDPESEAHRLCHRLADKAPKYLP